VNDWTIGIEIYYEMDVKTFNIKSQKEYIKRNSSYGQGGQEKVFRTKCLDTSYNIKWKTTGSFT
jgi:hypothetical protein